MELLLSEDGHSRFTSLLLRPDSPARLFVYYQPRDVRHGPDDVRAGHGAPVLFCTLGTDDRLRGKALFFLRNSAAGKAVDVDKAYDSDLLAGEMKGDVLQGLQSQLAAVYEPALMRRDDAEWGKADSASVQSFKTSLMAFRQDVAETLESLDSGVELQRPDASLFDLEAAARDCAKPSRLSPDLLRHFEGKRQIGVFPSCVDRPAVVLPLAVTGVPSDELSLPSFIVSCATFFCSLIPSESAAGVLESWCETIATLIGDRDRASTPEALAETVPNSEGPRGIITYWRQRMQKLTSIVEQLKKRECRIVISVMTALLSRGAVAGGAGAGAGGAASAAAGAQLSAAASSAFALLRRWKAVDITLTEATNEAKDNVKYLSTLAKFVEPLYTASPLEVIDALPALFNAIKMIHTIARYFNTPERMTDLFVKITHALIANCKAYILDTPGPGGAAVPDPSSAKALWNRDVPTLIARLEDCLKLNEAYNEDFRLTKQSLAATPAARKMEGLGEDAIFRTFDLFCRRVIKLVDTFATTAQFDALAAHNLEGLEPLLAQFSALLEDFKRKRHDLLAYADSAFDRDYVELNVRVGDLEIQLQRYINAAFASITSIEAALALLSKFTAVLQRESMREDLDSKMALIFTTFGHELDMVQAIYDKHKHSPPIARNMPPVAGNITWARHLLRRIEQPMAVFKQHPAVLQMKDARRIVKQYNKVARVLYAFEYLWLSAWVQSIETAKAGLQATLIIRHPDDGRLYVNLDAELLQLIREAKCLDRMGVDVPESAKVVLLQEAKYKQHFGDLAHALHEYARITGALIPVTAPLLKPALQDLEYRLRPGMITLTWTSMNIESYKASVASGLARLEELVHNVNDIVENRIESNLKLVSRTLLVDLPSDKSFSLDEFVALQEGVVTGLAATLQSKNVEVESAVTDLVHVLTSYPLDKHIERVSSEEIARIRAHYQHFFYAALLNATKASLNALKRRVSTVSVAKVAGGAASAAAAAHQAAQRPFFETEVKLQSGEVRLSPSIDDVQHCINRCAKTLLSCSKIVYDWDQSAVPEEARRSFFDAITKDIEVVRVVLLLTGSLQSLRQRSAAYLTTFERFSWLWTQDVDAAYDKFIATAGAANGGRPSLEDYERELNRFGALEEEISAIPDSFPLGALNLSTATLKHQLAGFAAEWKVKYSENLHRGARSAMAELSEYIKTRTSALSRPVDSLDSLRFAMLTLQAIRAKEASIDADTQPILDMYALLEHYLPPGSLSKEEMDEKSVLRSSWRRLLDKAVEVSEGITRTQAGFRKRLLTDVRTFVSEVAVFRADYLAHGPMVEGVPPQEAMERLRRYEDEFELRNRKRELYNGGEDLFALPTTEFPELDATSKELQLLGKLYSLYKDVMSRMDEWRTILWADVVANVASMSTETEGFASRCKKLPKKLRQWPAFQTLNKKIEDFQTVLPLLQELSKDSMRPRHWEAVAQCTTGNPRSLPVYEATFSLAQLLATPLVEHKEEVEEICDLADKQLAIEIKLKALSARWDVERFIFSEWKNRGIPVLQGVLAVVEELEASQMDLQTILASRAVAPFREQAAELLKTLSDTSETLELWLKVQLMWSSLEGVFLSGDIARQMPRVATRFQKIDKDWQRMMATAQERGFVVECCANEILRLSLPGMFDELEKCQKALEGYLENKRALFPRFYFVSNPVLLQILSQGSDPQAIQAYYEKVFDSISCVEHDKKDKALIREIISREGSSDERITLRRPVKAAGNIEDWLGVLLAEMRRSMKELAEEAANEIAAIGAAAAAGGGSTAGLDMLRGFVDGACGQYSLLGLQLMWTADCQQALEAGKAGKKNAMRDANDRALAVLSTLSSWCLQDLGSKMNRTKIETLVTIQVHQRDVINDLYGLYRAKKVAGADDFAWQQQCRFYWQPDGSDTVSSEGACKISITDVDFQYQYEYLGCKERLVITPLTDRCYITLAQAMGMHFGGAPAGPAGTGKTETTKDMGRALGIYVVVTNCSRCV
jgi:dynein heavy chain